MRFTNSGRAQELMGRFSKKIQAVVEAEIIRQNANGDPILALELIKSNHYPNSKNSFSHLRSEMARALNSDRQQANRFASKVAPAIGMAAFMTWITSLAASKTAIVEAAIKIRDQAPGMIINHAYQLADHAHPVMAQIATYGDKAGYAALGAALVSCAVGVSFAAQEYFDFRSKDLNLVDEMLTKTAQDSGLNYNEAAGIKTGVGQEASQNNAIDDQLFPSPA